MKKLLLITGTIAMATISCEHSNVYHPKTADFDNISPFTSYEVPIENEKVTIVTYGKDTLAITGIPMTIEVPKEALRSRTKAGNGLKVEYSNDPKFEGYKNGGTTQAMFTLFFEDTRSGDNDYNDLILSIKRTEINYDDPVQCYFEIFPIAMGATKNFKLGFIEGNTGQEFIVCENCREDLFGGRTGFINTDPEVAMVTNFDEFKTPTYQWNRNNNWNNTNTNWFIETETERMYIALSDKAVKQESIEDFGNDKGKPYGIALYWCDWGDPYAILLEYGGPFYPTERTPIQQLYGHFNDWVSGKVTILTSSDVNNTDPKICFNIANPR